MKWSFFRRHQFLSIKNYYLSNSTVCSQKNGSLLFYFLCSEIRQNVTGVLQVKILKIVTCLSLPVLYLRLITMWSMLTIHFSYQPQPMVNSCKYFTAEYKPFCNFHYDITSILDNSTLWNKQIWRILANHRFKENSWCVASWIYALFNISNPQTWRWPVLQMRPCVGSSTIFINCDQY